MRSTRLSRLTLGGVACVAFLLGGCESEEPGRALTHRLYNDPPVSLSIESIRCLAKPSSGSTECSVQFLSDLHVAPVRVHVEDAEFPYAFKFSHGVVKNFLYWGYKPRLQTTYDLREISADAAFSKLSATIKKAAAAAKSKAGPSLEKSLEEYKNLKSY